MEAEAAADAADSDRKERAALARAEADAAYEAHRAASRLGTVGPAPMKATVRFARFRFTRSFRAGPST